jgi:hypothetical protein
MRNEAIWLVQFLVSISIVAAAFGAGLWMGRRRSGRPIPATWDTLDAEVEVRASTGRRDLFAPEVDLRGDTISTTAAAPRELTSGS